MSEELTRDEVRQMDALADLHYHNRWKCRLIGHRIRRQRLFGQAIAICTRCAVWEQSELR